MASRIPFTGGSKSSTHDSTGATTHQGTTHHDSTHDTQHLTPQHDKAVHDPNAHHTGAHDTGTHAAVPAQSTGPTAHSGHVEAADRFGGINWGAAFFGWLVAVGLTILLTGIVGAIVTGVSESTQITQSDAQREAGTIGIAAGIVLLVVLALAYYAGGYVAGRMSRFDGGKQGLAVWIIGLLVTLLAIGLGAVFGSEYNIFDRVNLPRIPLSTSELSTGGLITAIAVVVLSLLAAMLGGKVGQRYHNKVDRVAHR
jgi:amino acid transporter